MSLGIINETPEIFESDSKCGIGGQNTKKKGNRRSASPVSVSTVPIGYMCTAENWNCPFQLTYWTICTRENGKYQEENWRGSSRLSFSILP